MNHSIKSVGGSIGLLVAALVLTAQAHAIPVLVGAQLYHSDAAGNDVEPGFQFSTNTGTTGHAFLPLDLLGDDPDAGAVDRNIAFRLTNGLNTFQFDNSASQFARDTYGLNLFFADSAIPLIAGPDLATPGTVGLAGNLAAVTEEGSGFYSVPLAGTDVASYGTQNIGLFAGRKPTAYSGAALFAIDGFELSIVDFVVENRFPLANNLFGGSFSIFAKPVAASAGVPEPGALALLGFGLIGLICMRRSRA